jgi:hypothetical protein
MLCWDSTAKYIKDAAAFRGFYSGEGHRTPIPNAFFDHVIPNETLTIIKVVGAVLRHTVGYQNQFGGRRSEAPLSYRYMQEFARIGDRRTLAEALRAAIDSGYIRCTNPGRFNSDPGKRRPARYAIRWLAQDETPATSSITLPAGNQSKNPTSSGSRTRPANQSKNPTKEKTVSNDTSKQQHAGTPAVAVENLEAYRLLRDAGFDERAATSLAQRRTLMEIEQQIAWLEERKPRANRLGLLRRAIEEDWAAPNVVLVGKQQQAARERERENEAREEAEEKHRKSQQAERCKRWLALSSGRRAEFRQAAINKAHPSMRSWLGRQSADRPVANFLHEMENSLGHEL